MQKQPDGNRTASPLTRPTVGAVALDCAGHIRFEGSEMAELFAREVSDSFAGLLQYNLVQSDGAFPAGFLHASPEGQLCHGQMWTRDAAPATCLATKTRTRRATSSRSPRAGASLLAPYASRVFLMRYGV